MNEKGPTLTRSSRRRMLQALSLAAAHGAAGCGQERAGESGPSIEELRGIASAHGVALTDERLERIRPAVAEQLAQLEAIRAFDLDETVEPAIAFQARR